VVTYYETAPEPGRKDTVRNSAGYAPETVEIPWVFADEKPSAFQFAEEPVSGVFSPADPADVDLMSILEKTAPTYL
ncbi:hypothetical protein DK853_46145, partial [Klebsiella oxytoca]